jgi:SAM-dependent methyltransferase
MAGMDKSALLSHILKVQIDAYGVFEIERLNRIISENKIKAVLDIGTGNGYFLVKLASHNPDVDFLGIDGNVHFLDEAKSLRKENGLDNVAFSEALFGPDYSREKYDLIISRFVLQHSASPKDFIHEVYKRLNDNGVFMTIDEYLFETNTDDPAWRDFYSKWIKCFNIMNCDPYIPRHITSWLNQIGFTDIGSSIQLYSPATVGGEAFKECIIGIASMLGRIYPDVMDDAFLNRLESWLDEINLSKSADPHLQISHNTARKPRNV